MLSQSNELIPFNTNDIVFVRLTDFGRERLNAEWPDFLVKNGHPHKAPEEDAEGWSRWTLWELMYMLGGYMNMSQMAFETNIVFKRR